MNNISAKKLRGHYDIRCMECGWSASSIINPARPRGSAKGRAIYIAAEHYDSHDRMQQVFIDGHLTFSPVRTKMRMPDEVRP